MADSPALDSANTQHQIAFSRYTAGVGKSLHPYLREIADYLEARLAKEGETIASKKKLNKLLADVEKRMNSNYTTWEKSEYIPAQEATVNQELEFQKTSVDKVVVNYESDLPSDAQIFAAAKRNPLLIGTKGGAVDFTRYTKDWKPQEIARAANGISSGFYAGQTTREITRNVVGLKSQGYADGILNTSRANIESMVRTSLTHLSVQAKEEFNKANDDLIIGYRIIATLDSRTSDTCKYQDGKVYLYKDGRNQPKPAFHPGCRTTTSPELSSDFDFLDKGATRASKGAEGGQQVSASTTYYDWLKTQPATFQDDALGKTKGLIFRNAGLTAEEFRSAATNQLGRPLTIDQMAASNKKIAEYLGN